MLSNIDKLAGGSPNHINYIFFILDKLSTLLCAHKYVEIILCSVSKSGLTLYYFQAASLSDTSIYLHLYLVLTLWELVLKFIQLPSKQFQDVFQPDLSRLESIGY